MDGTLTVAIHDFDAIRDALGIPQGKRILEVIAEMPFEQAESHYQRLDEIEVDLASRTQPQSGANELLSILHKNGTNLGILTRNNKKNAQNTLFNCGFSDFFKSECIIGRESVKPKPDPEGIFQLLNLWNASPDETVMVGNHSMDIEAGMKAGTFTIFLNSDPDNHINGHSGLIINSLDELLILFKAT